MESDLSYSKGKSELRSNLLFIVCYCLQISKKRVDSFKSGRTVPSLKLVATLSESSWDCKVPCRSHLTTLLGAKEPDNQMVILIDAVDLKDGKINCCFIDATKIFRLDMCLLLNTCITVFSVY